MMHDFTTKANKRFWSKVILPSMVGTNECWLWQGSKSAKGYGAFWIDGNATYAHRFAYEATIGPIADGLCACHTCDNRACCNPDHLWLGTHTDNQHDKVIKGRAAHNCGIKAGSHKLSEDEVIAIREMYASGQYKQWYLADLFGISDGQISLIVNRKCWAHL